MDDLQSIYVVRLISDKQMVGVFLAYEVEDILDLIDHACDPHLCEFAIVETLAIMWEGATYSIPDSGEEVRNDLTHEWMLSDRMRTELESATWTRIADAVEDASE